MPADQGAQNDAPRSRRRRRGHAGACIRAGLSASVGSTLAALGHHAVAEGPVPWRLVSAVTLAQFVLSWPLARSHLPVPMVLAYTLTVQGLLHLALTWMTAASSVPSSHGPHQPIGIAHPFSGNGHTWHHASAAMTAAHMTAALLAGWLLHRVDATLSGALTAVAIVRRVTTTVVGWLVPWCHAPAVTTPPAAPRARCCASPTAPDIRILHHTLVRRGPPGTRLVPPQVLPTGLSPS